MSLSEGITRSLDHNLATDSSITSNILKSWSKLLICLLYGIFFLFFFLLVFLINFALGHFCYFLKFKNDEFKWEPKVIFTFLNNFGFEFVMYLSWGKLHFPLLLNEATEVFLTKNGLFSTIQIKNKKPTTINFTQLLMTQILTKYFSGKNHYNIFTEEKTEVLRVNLHPGAGRSLRMELRYIPRSCLNPKQSLFPSD